MTETPTIRDECSYRGLNESKGNSCTDDDLCAACWMKRDVENNRSMYEAMGDL